MGHDHEPPHPADAYSSGTVKPPHSLEAEREVLSAALIDPKALGDLVESRTADAFYFERHRLIYRAMVDLGQRGVGIDVVTLVQALRDQGHYDRVGGSRTVGEILDRAGTVSNLPHYIGIVRDKARLRRLIETAQAIEAEAFGDVDSVDAFVERASARFGRVLGEVAKPVESIALRSIADRVDSGEDNWLEKLPAELPVLLRGEKNLPFMRHSRVAALIAPGGTGKTYALCDLAMAVATGGRWLGTYETARKGKVLLALGEEDEEEVRRRLWHIAGTQDLYGRAEMARNIVPLALMGQRVAMLQRNADGNPAATPWFEQLRQSLEQSGPWCAVILDPWSRWGGSDAETDANAATFGISLLESLTQVSGRPTVIVAHHTRKVMAGARQDASDTRGSSAFTDGARLVCNLFRRADSELLEMRVTKSNYTVTGSPLVLARGEAGILLPATAEQIEAEREAIEEAQERAYEAARARRKQRDAERKEGAS